MLGGLYDTGWRGDEPLDTNDQLDEDGEAEEEGLIGGGEVDTAVERDQEDEFDEEGGVDQGVGQASA